MEPTPNQLSDKDRLLARDDNELPFVEDPSKPHTMVVDPKNTRTKGQGTDPKADDIDYTT